MAENCWVLTHPDGIHIDNGDYVEHFENETRATERAARDAATDVLVAGCHADGTPRQLDQPCVLVICGCPDCTEIFDEPGDGYTVHFDTAKDAESVTEAEWTRHPDGTYRCVACSPGGDCDCPEKLALAAAEQDSEASL